LRRAVAAGIETFWPEENIAGSGMTAFERANDATGKSATS
jgi:hypothetical protein